MRAGVAIFGAAAIVAATLPFVRQHDEALYDLLGRARIALGGEEKKAKSAVDPPALTDVDLTALDDRRDVIVAPAHGKRTAELTLDPVFQRAAARLLRDGRLSEGAIVMTDIRTGKVLIWASYNDGRPRDVAAEATAPSASVFKIVTGAALVEAGAPMSQKHCYIGGEHGISRRDLEPDEDRDKYCATLALAMGRSLNIVFARQAVAHLSQDKLGAVARRLGWATDVPFDVAIAPSTLDLPDDELEFARAAAGFWHSTLSPFQAANLAQTIANGGEMIRSTLVARVLDEDGSTVIYEAPTDRHVLRRAVDERTAWAVARMMEQTVDNGTSFATFHDRSGRPFLPDIPVAGKTGTLSKKDPEILYTWWVGFAPADKPEVAVATLAVNRGAWHVKGTHLASDILRIYFADQGRKGVSFPSGFKDLKRRRVDPSAAPSNKPKGADAPAHPPSDQQPNAKQNEDDDEEKGT
jgi:cell division protein FtsI/penicillin-binding protein 2